MNIRNQTISNETIVLNSGKLTGLGPAVVLRHCRVECHITARELVLTDVEMHHCTFVAKKQLTGYKFLEARFYDCAFEGTYSGCDFGKRAEVYDNLGDIARCDFSKARLDACRFFGSDMCSMNLVTKMPNIVIRLPVPHQGIDLAALPSGLQTYVRITSAESADCTAVVDDVAMSAKRLRVEPEALLSVARALGAKNPTS